MKLCKHDFKIINSHLTEGGMNKVFYYKCSKCNKEITKTLDKNKLPKYGISFKSQA